MAYFIAVQVRLGKIRLDQVPIKYQAEVEQLISE